jgi:alkanesulfonate monooxygenase
VTVELHWFLPTAGDSRDVVPTTADSHRRAPTIEYLGQLAQAAENLGFAGVLTPTGTWCEDAWLVTAALLPLTQRLKFLVAFRPGFLSPTLAAQMAATYQRISHGRLLLNVVTGGEPAEQRRFGDWLDHDERYERTDEFLAALRGAWSGRPYDVDGRHYHLAGATVRGAPKPAPPIYFGGASPAAERVAARHADVYLMWGEPPADVTPRLQRMRALAEAEGRSLRFGIRLHVITRDRAAEAWAETERVLATMNPKAIAAAQAGFARSESTGQRRMAALHGGRTDDLVVAPNLWAGIGLVRGGAGTALVGSHQEVAERLVEYHRLGFDEFILSGHPHLEEAYWFAEGVMPELRRAGLLGPAGAGSEGEAGGDPSQPALNAMAAR